jgi:hypothetical protein
MKLINFICYLLISILCQDRLIGMKHFDDEIDCSANQKAR